MNTPIADFIKKYAKNGFSRFHMPGHKGKSFVGCEKFDITEIDGADVLSLADGIIAQSENNASALFKTRHTFYTTEGSTTAICAMLALVKDEDTVILAARNVHKAFIHACALLDYKVTWMTPETSSSILKCEVSASSLEKQILGMSSKPTAVYITSPDYLGNTQNIPEIADVCRKYDIPLLVDNAHGAYHAFLEKSMHPIALGATVCCDSAHKTLPVLTGGAYLHISDSAPDSFAENARGKLAIFSSTSPSYLTLQSLDLCNKYLSTFGPALDTCIKKAEAIKEYISSRGFKVLKSEPLKIVLNTSASGYVGYHFADILRKHKIEPEFSDRDFVVLMVTPQSSNKDFARLKKAFAQITPKSALDETTVTLPEPATAMSIREAVFAPSELIDISLAEGRICAAPTVSCPPAIPIAVSGEKITEEHIKIFKLYGIDKIKVVK